MTVSTTNSVVTAYPNGVTTQFPVNYRFFMSTDLRVIHVMADGSQSILDLNSDYTVSGAGSQNGGYIQTIGAPLNGGSLVIARIMTPDQLTDLRNQGGFFAEIHEDVFDRLTLLIQQALDANDRVLSRPITDPESVSGEIPPVAARASRLLGFDALGNPVASSLSIEQIEQQPALAQAAAAEAAASAGAAAGSAASAQASMTAAQAAEAGAQAALASTVPAAVPLLQPMFWPDRSIIPQGYVAMDGQLLSRATYPDAWALVSATPTIRTTDASWLSDNLQRGLYSTGNGTTTFRLPDYNGKSPGAIGAPFPRGDGALSAGTTGVIQPDALQNITGSITNQQQITSNPTVIAGAIGKSAVLTTTISRSGTGAQIDGITVDFDASRVARTANETRPLSVTGCWIVKLFGAAINVGSADAAQLASDYANLNAAFQNSQAATFARNYLQVEDRKPANTSGGTATAATWTTRDLNTTPINRIAGASLAANQITLPPGTYRYRLRAPALAVGGHVVRLRNITAGITIDSGNTGFSTSAGVNAQTDAVAHGEFTLAATSALEVQHNVATTRASSGFGVAANLGVQEVYTQCEFWRLG